MTDRPDSPTIEVPGERIAAGLAIVCVVARLLVPTESTGLGDTLWIACLLFPAAMIHLMARWRHGHRIQLDAFTVAVGLIIVGHLTSGLWLCWFGGQRRAAVNVMWEWMSLGAACVVLRRSLAAVHVIVTMIVVLAGMGIWQYYEDFPRLREQYAAHVSDAGSPVADFQTRQELTALGIPESAAARALFADRLASMEPLGPFALANTLGGLLAVAVLFVSLSLLSIRRSPGQYVAGVLIVTPLLYCLVLTKSRTAVAGSFAALILFVIHRLFIARKDSASASATSDGKRRLLPAIVVVGLIATAILAAVLSGGLDEQVISEAPKSLQYRLQYWQGSIATLRDSPILGTGPGNFRQHYNRHKLAESSEEILDPHNLFLDAWCQGGLLALVGALLLVGIVIRRFCRPEPGEPVADVPAGWPLAAALGGFALVFAQKWLTGQERPELTASLAAGFVVVWFGVRYVLAATNRTVVVVAGSLAAIGLVVHLLGAGGFGMPAVMQVGLILIGVSVTRVERPLFVRRWVGLTPAIIAVVCLFGCLLTAAIPVHRADYLMRRGDTKTGSAALSDYGQADLVDALDPEPVRRFGQALVRQRRLRHALAAWARAHRRDPWAVKDERALAWTLQTLWQADPTDESLIESAVGHMRAAVSRYPTNPQLVAELAIVEDHANDPARIETARRALELEAINRKYGHRDRYLSPVLVNQLNSVIARKEEQPPARGEL